MRTGDLPEATANIAAATLKGDIRDFMLGQAKRNSKPWDKRSEREQQSFIDACNVAAEDVTRRAVTEVASRGFDAIEFSWGTITLKDGGITAQVKCDGTLENVQAMLSGGRAIIVLARPLDFFGERTVQRADPDQPDLMDTGKADGTTAGMEPLADTRTHAQAATENAEKLEGIRDLNATEPLGETAPPKRRGRRSAEERVAANAAAASRDPSPAQHTAG